MGRLRQVGRPESQDTTRRTSASFEGRHLSEHARGPILFEGQVSLVGPMMSQLAPNAGTVYLVGAGPGDPGLITVRGTQVLATADLVLYDYLVNPELLQYVPLSAERLCLGHPHSGRALQQAEIDLRMIAAATAGKTVVRLKSGDPYLFGRGAEEVEALRRAGIACEVIPGVTAALAAASSARIAITHRDVASAVALITGHQRADQPHENLDYQALALFPGTLVFYMGMTSAQQWSSALLRGGKPPSTPVAIVRRASWPDQESFRCTLDVVAEVIQQQAVHPPAVIVVGDAVAFGDDTQGEALR